MPIYYLRFLFSDALAMFAIFLPFLLLFHATALKRGRGEKAPVLHLIAVYLFCFALMTVLCITGIPTIYSMRIGGGSLNLVPFDVFRTNYMQYYQNVLLFVPMGFLPPLAWKKLARAPRTIAFGLALSLAIEIAQRFSFRASDIDDLMMNTLGAILGYVLFAFARRLLPKISVFSAESDGLWRFEPLFCIACAWCVMLFAPPFLMEWVWAFIR